MELHKVETATEVSITTEDLCSLLLFSFRYALGQHTYVPSYISQLIRDHAKILTSRQLDRFKKETREYIRLNRSKEYSADLLNWYNFSDWCDQEIKERKKRE